MKLMFCEDCADLVAPNPVNNSPRNCRCGRHHVWWLDGGVGTLRVHDIRTADAAFRTFGDDPDYDGVYAWWPKEPRAYVIGLTNRIFTFPGEMSEEVVQGLIDEHDDYYLFKRYRSLVIRIRPGDSGDTAWASLPVKDGQP